MQIVSFVLPCLGRNPSGGFKMIYEYANALAEHGYRVNLLFDVSRSLKRFHMPEYLRYMCVELLNRIYPRWFYLHPNVKKKCLHGIKDEEVPDGDYIFATAIHTAFDVQRLSQTKGEKLYFIQGFEAWAGFKAADVHQSYQLGMKNIVISKWLEKEVNAHADRPAIYIPNFVKTDVFFIGTKPEMRNPYSIAMLCAVGDYKGCKYGLAALKKLKKIYPQLQAHLFGTIKNVEGLEDWMNYTFSASEQELRRIYNTSAIYLYPAVKEGWGLTGMEAMACGCAYVSSDYGGVHEYADDGKEVLLSQPRDV